MSDIEHMHIQIAFLQETWLSGECFISEQEWSVLCSEHIEGAQVSGRGLALITSTTLDELIGSNLRLISQSNGVHYDYLAGSYGGFLLINVYIHVNAPLTCLAELAETLGSITARLPHLIPIIAGDFNCPCRASNHTLADELRSQCGVSPLLQHGIHTTRVKNLLDNIFYHPMMISSLFRGY
jgi:hypothetical protein